MKSSVVVLFLVRFAEPFSDFIHFINQQNTTWKSGYNFPKSTTLEDLQKLNGALKDAEFFQDLELKVHNITYEIPESFDSRLKWSRCESISEIRNQGHCGSCWAFGATEAMSDRLCIASNATKKFKFSAQDLLACCEDCGYGCNGGYSSKAWEYWVSNGIVSGGDYNSKEGCQPYTSLPFKNSTTPQCTQTCYNENYTIPYKQDKRFGLSNYRIEQNVEQIQAEIMSSGPVQVTYVVYEDFYTYKSGVYQHTIGEKSGHHAVKMIGWGSENGTPYWLVANSWGTKWGNGGFFKIFRGGNECGIEEHILAGEPIIK